MMGVNRVRVAKCIHGAVPKSCPKFLEDVQKFPKIAKDSSQVSMGNLCTAVHRAFSVIMGIFVNDLN